MTLREVHTTNENIDTSEDPSILVDDTATRKYIDGTMNKIADKKKERAAINIEIQAIYAAAEAMGLDKKGLKLSIARWELDESRRESMDFTYVLCCETKKIGFQHSLFDGIDPDEITIT